MKLVIKRVSMLPSATFGVFLRPDLVPFSLTLERPWFNNQQSISCIPAGDYRVQRCRKSPDYGYSDSPKFGNTFQVMDVPGRQFILFHKGNLISDSHGCILVGEQFEELNGVPGIAASAKGFDEFLRLTAHVDEFNLRIVEA